MTGALVVKPVVLQFNREHVRFAAMKIKSLAEYEVKTLKKWTKDALKKKIIEESHSTW